MANSKHRAALGASLVIFSSVFYASYGIWTKLLGDYFGGYTASAWRSVITVALLIPLALYFRKLEPLRLRRTLPYIAAMVLASCFIWGPLYYAILRLGMGISLTVSYACIVLGMLVFGKLLDRERFTPQKLAAVALGLAGLGLICAPSGSGGHLALVPLAAAAVSGLAAGANMVITKRIPYKATQATIVHWFASIAANVCMAVLLHDHWPTVTWDVHWFYLVIFGLATLGASWSFVAGVKLIDAGMAGILGLLQIVFGIMFGYGFFHEALSAQEVTGAALIITATALPYVWEALTKPRLWLQSVRVTNRNR